MSNFQDKNNDRSEDDQKRVPASPKRQFSNAPLPVSPSQEYHRLLVTLYWLAPILAVLVISAGGIFFALGFNKVPVVTPEKQTTTVESTTSSSFLDMGTTWFLESYLESVGGRDVLSGLSTASFEGKSRTPDGSRDVKLLVRGPDQASLSYESDDGSKQRFLLNGELAWEVVDVPGGSEEIRELGDNETREMALTGRLHNPLREHALGGRGNILFIREGQFGGAPCYHASIQKPNGSVVECYIDRVTLYLIGIESVDSANNERISRRVVYDDHRMSAGVVEPFRSTVYINGEFISEIRLESVEFDLEISPALFEIPEELR